MHALLLAMRLDLAPIVWASLGIAGAFGLLAVASPQRFSAISRGGSHWVDTSKVLAALDKQVHIDHLVLPHCRLLGAAVLASVAALGFIFVRYF